MKKTVNDWKTYMGKHREPGPTGTGLGNHYKNFMDAIHQGTRKNCPALAATAENVVFNLPPENRVTAEDLKDS